MDELHGEAPEGKTWSAAARTALPRHLKRILWWPPAAIALWFALNALFHPRYAYMAFVIVHQIVGAMLPLILAASVREEVLDSRRAVRRYELAHAMKRLGVTREDLEPTEKEAIGYLQAESGCAYIMLSAVSIASIISMVWFSIVIRGAPFFLALFLPVGFLVVLILDEKKYTTSSLVQDAHAEKVYRRALEDRSQLAGGLVLDEHVGASGGELTVQAEVGGLEVHDEVALDLEAREEEVAEQANEVVEERGR